MTYPSSTVDRSLTFRTSYNFIIGRSYNIRLDAGMKLLQSVQLKQPLTYWCASLGVAVDATYCGLNSTAISDSTFWSVTVGEFCHH